MGPVLQNLDENLVFLSDDDREYSLTQCRRDSNNKLLGLLEVPTERNIGSYAPQLPARRVPPP